MAQILTFPSVPAISLPVVEQENTPGMRGDHFISEARSPCLALGSSERTSPLLTSHSRARPSRPVLMSRLGSWGHHPMLSTPCRQGSNTSSRDYVSTVQGTWGVDTRMHKTRAEMMEQSQASEDRLSSSRSCRQESFGLIEVGSA